MLFRWGDGLRQTIRRKVFPYVNRYVTCRKTETISSTRPDPDAGHIRRSRTLQRNVSSQPFLSHKTVRASSGNAGLRPEIVFQKNHAPADGALFVLPDRWGVDPPTRLRRLHKIGIPERLAHPTFFV